MEGLELICFEMISNAGAARSCYIEAIQAAKEGDFKAAQECMDDGAEAFVACHKAHHQLITDAANGKEAAPTLLLIHAEDQLMAAESFQILAGEFIDLYKRLDHKSGEADA